MRILSPKTVIYEMVLPANIETVMYTEFVLNLPKAFTQLQK
jgi:hypothetical protein